MKYGLSVSVKNIDLNFLNLDNLQINNSDNFGNKIRSSSNGWIFDNQVRKHFLNIVNDVNISSSWLLNVFYCEPIQYTVYNENDFYDWHIDQTPPTRYQEKNFFGCRKISMSLFLSDPQEYEGGELDLELGPPNHKNRIVSYKEKKGTAVFFQSDVWHRVRPVKSGVRKSLVCWFAGSPYV